MSTTTGPEPRETDTPAGHVAWLEAGSGRPLVCLHGFPDAPETFQALMRDLAEDGFRCLAPWLPGYGHTAIPRSGGLSLMAVAEMLDAWLSEVVDESALAILGHDWGSVIAQLLAGIHQEGRTRYELEGVILAAVPPTRRLMANMSPAQIARSRYIGRFQLPGAARRIRRRRLDYIRKLWRRWSPDLPGEHPQLCRVLEALALPGALERAIAYYRYALNPMYLPLSRAPVRQGRLLRMRKPIPALVLAGARDGCIGDEIFRGSEREFPHPGTRLEILESAGHFMHLDAPERFRDRVLSFLRQIREDGDGRAADAPA